jgi:mannosyltransferase OCH1-like enzyme
MYTVICIVVFILVLTVLAFKHVRQNFLIESRIPKKLFQIVVNKNRIDPKTKVNIAYNKRNNPDWEYKLLDLSDAETYIKTNYSSEHIECYNMINPKYPEARINFFSYLLMYKEGGVYLDSRVISRYLLNQTILPTDQYLLFKQALPKSAAFIANPNIYQSQIIISVTSHPFLDAVIKLTMSNIRKYDIGKQGVLKVTGQVAYTDAIAPILDKYKYRVVDSNKTGFSL